MRSVSTWCWRRVTNALWIGVGIKGTSERKVVGPEGRRRRPTSGGRHQVPLHPLVPNLPGDLLYQTKGEGGSGWHALQSASKQPPRSMRAPTPWRVRGHAPYLGGHLLRQTLVQTELALVERYHFSSRSPRAVWLLLAGLAFSPGIVAGQNVPATNQTVDAELDTSLGNGDHLIYVNNRSSVEIIVTSVRLIDCENVQGSCSVIKKKIRLNPGGRVLVHRVRARYPDQSFSFRYSFTWEGVAAEGPTAQDVAKDSTALIVDSVIVRPAVVDLQVGETLDLSQVLAIRAMNAAGHDLPNGYFFSRVVLGEEFVTLDGTKLTGRAAGTAAVAITASMVAGPVVSTRGAARILVRVLP